MFPTQQSPSTALRMSQNAICFQDFHFAVASTNLKVVQKLQVFWHSVARPHFNDPRFFEKPTSSLSFHGDRHPPSPPQVAEGCVFSGMSTLRSCMHARQLHRKTFELQGSTVDTAVQRSSMLAESRTFPKFPPSPSHRPVLICSESKIRRVICVIDDSNVRACSAVAPVHRSDSEGYRQSSTIICPQPVGLQVLGSSSCG